jgi:hypothetical protein
MGIDIIICNWSYSRIWSTEISQHTLNLVGMWLGFSDLACTNTPSGGRSSYSLRLEGVGLLRQHASQQGPATTTCCWGTGVMNLPRRALGGGRHQKSICLFHLSWKSENLESAARARLIVIYWYVYIMVIGCTAVNAYKKRAYWQSVLFLS